MKLVRLELSFQSLKHLFLPSPEIPTFVEKSGSPYRDERPFGEPESDRMKAIRTEKK